MPQTVSFVVRASTGASSTFPVMTGNNFSMNVAFHVTGISVQSPVVTSGPTSTATFLRRLMPATCGPTSASPESSRCANHA